MERVVLKTFGKVDNLQPGTLLKFSQVDETFVRHTSLGSLESNVVVRLQPLGDIVCVEQGDFGDFCQALSTKHLDVCPGDCVDRCRTVWSGRDGVDSLFSACGDDGVGRKEWGEMSFTRDWPDTRSSSAVGDREGLVEIGMGHITADSA